MGLQRACSWLDVSCWVLFGGLFEMKKNSVGARLREAEGKKVIYSAIGKGGHLHGLQTLSKMHLVFCEGKLRG